MNQYLQVFLKGIQRQNQRSGKSSVVAFTSYLPEEGVSYVVQSFGLELSKRTGKRTLIADAERLSQIDVMKYGEISHYCFQTEISNLWTLPPEGETDQEIINADENDTAYLQAYGSSPLEIITNNLQTLRYVFDFILLDCPAISISEDVTFLVPETDGVMVVVEADRTKREQIQNAQQTIERADGNLLGFVLNKRQYTVPSWIYNSL
jgi:Mrp family chromosome partitioning ATPase